MSGAFNESEDRQLYVKAMTRYNEGYAEVLFQSSYQDQRNVSLG